MRRRQIYAIREQEAEQLRREVIRSAFKVEEADANADSGQRKEVSSVNCPTCGKALQPRGAHFHIRACKG
jgi:hypothetical protein